MSASDLSDHATAIGERPESVAEQDELAGISPDLPFELQSKLYDQLAAGGAAGAGLTITLVGTILKGSVLVWLSTVEFALAALLALAGQTHLIENLFKKRPVMRSARIVTAITVMLIGMGVGSLATSVYLEGKTGARATDDLPKPAATVPTENGAAGED